jgi:heptosyltransferase-3
VLQDNPFINAVIVSDRGAGHSWERIRSEIASLAHIRRMRFDLVIDLTSGDRAALLGFLSGARYRVAKDPEDTGFWGKKYLYTHRCTLHKQAHMVEQNLEIVRQIGMDTQDRSVYMAVPAADREWARDLMDRHSMGERRLKIHLHPTARWLFKCWPDEAMAALMDRLSDEDGAQIFLTCGPAPAEVQKATRIVALARRKPVDLIGKTTLPQLAALSAQCDLFVGVDTAPMHIAAAVGTKVIALFGPTGALQWRPWGVGHRLLQDNAGCDPNGPTGCARTKRCLCLERISVETVLREIRAAGPTPERFRSTEFTCAL